MKMDLALNNLQWLICYKTQPNQGQTKPNFLNLHEKCYFLQIDVCSLILKEYSELEFL